MLLLNSSFKDFISAKSILSNRLKSVFLCFMAVQLFSMGCKDFPKVIYRNDLQLLVTFNKQWDHQSISASSPSGVEYDGSVSDDDPYANRDLESPPVVLQPAADAPQPVFTTGRRSSKYAVVKLRSASKPHAASLADSFFNGERG